MVHVHVHILEEIQQRSEVYGDEDAYLAEESPIRTKELLTAAGITALTLNWHPKRHV